MTAPLHEMPASIELTWAQYRLVLQALFDAEEEFLRWGPAREALVVRLRDALEVLIHSVWPEIGEIDDEGTV